MWFGGRYPREPSYFFGTYAVDARAHLELFEEFDIPADQKKAWLEDRQGACVGELLAKRLGWKVGDRVTLESSLVPGVWQFNIRAMYSPKTATYDKTSMMFHYAYLNEGAPPIYKNQIGYIVSRVAEAGKSAEMIRLIDRTFDQYDVQTQSASELAFNLSFLGMVSSFLTMLDAISVIIIGIMLLILANTISMGVRERTSEYGTLRALGFQPGHVRWLVIGEALAVGVFGGMVGLALSYPLINVVMAPAIEANMGFFFSQFYLRIETAGQALLISILAGPISALSTAFAAGRIPVIEALKRTA
jgi:putative ABC transport system permease protein